MLDNVVIRHIGHAFEIDLARKRLLSQIADIADLLPRKAAGAHLLFRKRQYRFRRDRESAVKRARRILTTNGLFARGLKPLKDGLCRGTCQLLEDDGTRHGFVCRRTPVHAQRPDLLNDGGHDRVALFQMSNYMSHRDKFIYGHAPQPSPNIKAKSGHVSACVRRDLPRLGLDLSCHPLRRKDAPPTCDDGNSSPDRRRHSARLDAQTQGRPSGASVMARRYFFWGFLLSWMSWIIGLGRTAGAFRSRSAACGHAAHLDGFAGASSWTRKRTHAQGAGGNRTGIIWRRDSGAL